MDFFTVDICKIVVYNLNISLAVNGIRVNFFTKPSMVRGRNVGNTRHIIKGKENIMSNSKIEIKINSEITPDELYEFYEVNDICEKGYGKEVAARILDHSSLIAGAFIDNKLVGLARAMFDGRAAEIVEFCLSTDLQGKDLEYSNGSIIEKDSLMVGKQLGEAVIEELHRMGAFFISAVVFEEAEKKFFESVGFKKNDGHINYIIDRRLYVIEGQY